MLHIVPQRDFRHVGSIPSWGLRDPRVEEFELGSVHIDLSQCQHIHPAAVAWCVIYGLLVRWRDRRCILTLPTDRAVAGILQAAGAINQLQTAGTEVRGDVPDSLPGETIVLPMSRFRTETETEVLENAVYDALLGPQSPAPDLAAIAGGHFAELAANAVQHGPSPIGALATVQAVDHNGGRQLVFVIADAGIGIKASLHQNALHRYAVPNEWMAISHATGELVSGTADPNRGIGLYEARNSALGSGTALTIHSGAGILHISGRDGLVAHRSNTFPGTLVQMSFDL